MLFGEKMDYINFSFGNRKKNYCTEYGCGLIVWSDTCNVLWRQNCVVIRCSFVHCSAEPNPCKVRYGCQDNGPPTSSGQMPSHLRRTSPRSCYTIVLFFAVTTEPFQSQRQLDNKNMKMAQRSHTNSLFSSISWYCIFSSVYNCSHSVYSPASSRSSCSLIFLFLSFSHYFYYNY